MNFFYEFTKDLRWDIVITLIASILLEMILMIRRAKKNRKLKNKKDIFQWRDFAFSITTSATFYGGISAIYLAMKGKLLFDKAFIISQEYIVLFAGLVLVGFAYSTFKTALKSIGGKKDEEN